MKLIAQIVKPIEIPGLGPTKFFHVCLAPGLRRFCHEEIVRRHIGPRPWSEMHYVDDDGRVHEVFAK